MIKKLVFLILLALCTCAMFFFSGQSGVESGEVSLGLADRLLAVFPWLGVDPVALEPVLRKLAHLSIFALEGFLLFMWINSIRRGLAINALISTGICAAIGVLNELHQLIAEERSCQISDMLIDFLGGAIGVAAGVFTVWLIHKLDRRQSL